MKQFSLLLLLSLAAGLINAQSSVAINSDGSIAHASAILDIKSTTLGFLAPRMTTAQRLAIVGPASGLLVFDSNIGTYFYCVNSVWRAIDIAKSLEDADGDTKIQVEKNTDEDIIRFRINGNERLKILETTSGALRLHLNDDFVNTYIGTDVGMATNVGVRNTGIGYHAMKSNTDGIQNTAIGYLTMANNTTGNSNVAIGWETLTSNVSGGSNTAIGPAALDDNVDGNWNVGVGTHTLSATINGDFNVALGYSAGSSFNHGDQNTFVGTFTDANANGYNNSTALGNRAEITSSNQVRLGNAAINSIGGFQSWTTLPSDARFKTNVTENVPGLAFISKLRPVTYQIDIKGIQRHIGQTDASVDNEVALAQVRTGFLAQEVEKAAREVGFDFDGVDAPKNEKDLYGIRYAEFTVPLVKAVQELAAENNHLKADIATLLKRVEGLEAQLKR